MSTLYRIHYARIRNWVRVLRRPDTTAALRSHLLLSIRDSLDVLLALRARGEV